jgi:hypothetical protein
MSWEARADADPEELTEEPPAAAPIASIDDLLGHDEEPIADEVEQRPPARGWIRGMLLVVVATAATLGALRMVNVQVNPLLVFAGFVALRLLQQFLADVVPPPVPQVPPRRRAADREGVYTWQATDALRSAVRRWEQQLGWSQSEAARFSRNVLPVLAELTDERLRLRHGITRASDPQRARQLLGEPFWQLLADPDRRPPKPRELAAHVEALERL